MNTWFRLDISAMQDEKVVVLRKRYGFEGVGVYFMLAMECYKNNGALPAEKIPFLFEAYDIKNGAEILQAIVDVCLLRKKNDVYVSDRITKEIAIAEEWTEKKRLAGKKGGEASARIRHGSIKPIPEQPSSNAVASVQQNEAPYHTVPNHTLPSLGQKNEKADTEVLQTFFNMAEKEQWSEHTYTQAKIKQFYELNKEDKVEILKKMRVANNAFFSKSEETRKLSKKIYHETVGLIQDRALDRKNFNSKTIAKRKEYGEESEIDKEPF